MLDKAENATKCKIVKILRIDKGPRSGLDTPTRRGADPRRVSAFMANGGIVPGALGSPQLILAHGGETVLPTHKRGGGMMGGSVINVTVNAGVGTDGFSVGQQVVNVIKQYERANGASWRGAA